MKSGSSDQRNPIESIVSDYAESIRHGHHDSIDPVVTENPELEPELRDLLPVIQQLERARKAHVDRPAGLASLGSERPDHLGDFQLIRQIGRGGMGVVFEAVQTSLGRRVAVKVLPKSLLTDETQLKRFEQEARTAGALHHTNIVPVFGVGEDQGFHYYVMQRIHGRGLDRLLTDNETRLTPKEVAFLGQQAASALAYAHDQNVMHRDIKPANLIVDDHLQLWVTDFGVAKAIESEAVTRTGDVVGTLRYMAPEQIVGDADFRSDVYSLGVTLYELLAGRPAMDDASIRQALITRRPAPSPPPLRQLNPEVPRDLATILHTAMSVDTDARYQSAEALTDDLERFLRGDPISVRPLSGFQLAMRWARQNPAIAALASLFVLALFVFAVISTFGFVQVQRALDREQTARQNAEATADLASSALNQIFDRFTGNPNRSADSSSNFTSTPALSDETAELLEELLDYYGSLAVLGTSDPELQRAAANARYAMGSIHFNLGHYERAIDAFSRALKETSLDASIDAESQLRAAEIHNRIGLAHRLMGNPDLANQEHELALEILQDDSLFLEQTADRQFELARAHFLLTTRVLPGMGPSAIPPLSSLQLHRRRPDDRPERQVPLHDRLALDEPARDHVDSAIKILQQLRSQQPDSIGYAIALATALRRKESENRFAGARPREPVETESISILRDLYEKNPENELVRFEMSVGLADIDVLGPPLRWEIIEPLVERLHEAVRHFETLSNADPNVPKYSNALAHAQFKLGALLIRQADLERSPRHRELEQQAGLAFREAANQYAGLLRRHDTRGYRAWYALFLYYQAEMGFQAGLMEQAEQTLKASIEQWKWMTENCPDEEIGWRALPEAYDLLSETQQRLGKREEARESRVEADVSRLYWDSDP